MHNAQGFGVEIIVDGRPLKEIVHGGKTYLSAPWNRDYQIRFTVPKHSGRGGYRRFLAVTSVDGLDIMTGKRANASAGGYVITPAGSRTANDVPGFRLNKNEVAAFRFGDRRDSYAAQLDKPENVGVIGVIFHSEYQPQYDICSDGGGFEGTRGSHSPRRGNASAGAAGHDMGTEFGRRTDHRVENTAFTKDREVCRFVIEYASYESLVAAGIISTSPLGNVDPFGDNGGCKPPTNWRG